MHEGRIVFSQIMDFLPRDVFDACVKKYKGNYRNKGFTCRDQFLAMAFAQLTLREGLRGIQETLNANKHCLYHMGFRCKAIARNTLAHANEVRPWRIYGELAMALMARARKLYAGEPLAVELDATVFALDSTTIDLCLARFPWTPSQQSKAAVKLHVLLDLRGSIPDFIVISGAKHHDLHVFEYLEFIAGAYYIMDRAYQSFKVLYAMQKSGAFFVVRGTKNIAFSVTDSRSVAKETGLRCDQTIRMTGSDSRKAYPVRLRRVKYHDNETERGLVFLTNDFSLPALTIAQLYKQRWQIELFFKWLKQHLKIKTFYGYSENAVRSQLWIAVSVYCLLAIIKKELYADRDLHEIQEILSASIFQKMPILQVFSKENSKNSNRPIYNQLSLF